MKKRSFLFILMVCVLLFSMTAYAKGEQEKGDLAPDKFTISQENILLYPSEKASVSLLVEETVDDSAYRVEWSITDSGNCLVEDTSVVSNVKKVYTAQHHGSAMVKIDIYDVENQNIIVTLTCNIEVMTIPTQIVDNNAVAAVGVSKTLELSNKIGLQVKWTSSNANVAVVNAITGNYIGRSVGQAVIYADITSGEHTYRLQKQVIITNPNLKSTRTIIALGKDPIIKLNGLNAASTVTWTSSSKSKGTVSNGKVTTKKRGTIMITINADGRILKHKVIITNPTIRKTTFVMLKKQTATIKVRKVSKYSKIRYKSSNKKIATVSRKGRIKARRNGSTTIKVTVDNKTISCVVSIGNKKVVGAVKRAYKVEGAPYSQTYRMWKGYYDCSSLAWRCYKPYGIKMGVNVNWAPTAAAQARYFKNKKKIVAYKPISYKRLKVGDLIYYNADSTPNGRYRGIDHVAMYVGSGKIIHSNGRTMSVAEDTYGRLKQYIVAIARPV